MWLIKLPFKILILPIMVVVLTFSVFYKLFLNVSSVVVGLGTLLFAFGIECTLLDGMWQMTIIIFLLAAAVFFAFTCATALSMLFDGLVEKMAGFLWS